MSEASTETTESTGKPQIEFTDFATGLEYMQFVEAIARSSESGRAVTLPLDD